MKKLLATLLLIASLVVAAHAQNPKRELRSVWFTTVANIDWPSKTLAKTTVAQQKQELINYLDNYKARNFNGICIQVRSMADAIYPSSYEPWSAVISGNRGTNPGWDPLAYAVEECHKRGLECWAWVNPFRQRKQESNYTTSQDKDLANRGWLLGFNNYYVLNPGIPAARQRSLDVCREIYTNYAIDGMLFDDYFYPNNIPENSSAGDWSLYTTYKNGAGSSAMSIGDWRRSNVNTFVKDLYDQIQADRPDMRYGIGPAGVAYLGAAKYGINKPNVSTTDWQYGTIYCDPWAWIVGGYVDFLAPQLYWPTTHSTAPYEPLCSWYSTHIAKYNCHFYASLGSYRLGDGMLTNNTSGWSEMNTEVLLTRQYTANNAPGAIYYSGKYFDGPTLTGFGQYLVEHAYSTKALSPVVAWKDHPTYAAPANLTYKSGTLSWAATAGARSNSIIRYTVYAIPESLSIAQAMNADGDGFKTDYLLDVTYSTTFNVPAAKESGYWYAVSVYDGYGYESDPAIYGYSKGESAKTTLISPVGGATPSWDAVFKWAAVSGATYSLQIAGDAAFNDIVASRTDITANTVTVDLEGMTPGAKMYWRVFTHEPNKLATPSDAAYFTVPAKLAALNPTLISPSNGEEVSDNIVLKWSTVAGATGYRVVVATDVAFANARFTQEITGNVGTYSFASSRLGKGTYYWKVESVVPHHVDGVSSSRSFVINSVDVGNFEPGYVIKKDPVRYDVNGDMELTNLWMRSILPGFDNFPILNNGLFNRGITIAGDYVYMSGRAEASANSLIYLAKYSLLTGEHVSDIILDESGQVPHYPCNDVIQDSKGNILISNLSLTTTATIYIHKVNVDTGALTLVATIPCDDRVDHVGVYGDVNAAPFYVMAVGASTNNFYRWKIQNGSVKETKKVVTKSHYPTWAETIGIAPRIFPVSETTAFVDGASIAFSYYNIINGSLLASFNDNEALTPRGQGNNGGCVFTLNGKNYMVYASDDFNADTPHRYTIVEGDATSNFAGLRYMWTIPDGGLGGINSTTCSAPVAARNMGDGTAIIVGYATGNGLAAYRLAREGSNGVGVNDINARTSWSVRGREVDFGEPTIVKIYNLAGSLLQSVKVASKVTLPCAGTFIVNTPAQSRVVTVK